MKRIPPRHAIVMIKDQVWSGKTYRVVRQVTKKEIEVAPMEGSLGDRLWCRVRVNVYNTLPRCSNCFKFLQEHAAGDKCVFAPGWFGYQKVKPEALRLLKHQYKLEKDEEARKLRESQEDWERSCRAHPELKAAHWNMFGTMTGRLSCK